MKNDSFNLQMTLGPYLIRWQGVAKFLLICGVLGVAGFLPLRAKDLPKSLVDAVEQVGTEDAKRAYGTLRRYAYTDQPEPRLEARIALAQLDMDAGNLPRAATWVEEYQYPQPENLEWPRVRAYVQAAKIAFMQGNAFEGVKRLTDARKLSSGLAKVSTERGLSWMVEQKPDLKQALEHEEAALKTGAGYFRRKKISESAGWEPPKPGTDQWNQIKPEIETRIADLKRRIEIETYGLDFILYKEAQQFRKASHPLALDFTNVAAAFDEEGPIGGKVPGANYEMAVERYTDLALGFPDNPYGQAAKLYLAVCTAKMGDPDEAIKQLKAFYKEDPDGLYRGEALKLMGDLYLFAKWDKRNSKEAYERCVRWAEATGDRSRALDAYLVPEKSAKVSQPPAKVSRLNGDGLIIREKIPPKALVNRITSNWYLNSVLVDVKWRLGNLSIMDNDWDAAFGHFEDVKSYDKVLNEADKKNILNAHSRLRISARKKCVLATEDELRGLSANERSVVVWADLQLIIENFTLAKSLYGAVVHYGGKTKNPYAYMRGRLGQVLVERESGEFNSNKIPQVEEWIRLNPESPSCAFLLEICANYSRKNPELQQHYFSWIYNQYPNSFFAKRARYFEILHVLELNEIERRERMIEDFKRDYPDEEGYHASLDKYKVWLYEQHLITEKNKLK